MTRLRELRKRRGWTQEKAAESCGIGYKLYQLYEIGLKNNPGLLTLEKIAGGYDLDISALFAPTLPKTNRAKRENAKNRVKHPRKTKSSSI